MNIVLSKQVHTLTKDKKELNDLVHYTNEDLIKLEQQDIDSKLQELKDLTANTEEGKHKRLKMMLDEIRELEYADKVNHSHLIKSKLDMAEEYFIDKQLEKI